MRPSEWNPIADPRACVARGRGRLTVLTGALVRIEWSPDARFEDRASIAFVNRLLPVAPFRVRDEGSVVVVATDELEVRWRVDADGSLARPDASALSIERRRPLADGRRVRWHWGMEDRGNLGGTARTLDGVTGACPLE